jgi:hypothetical protein
MLQYSTRYARRATDSPERFDANYSSDFGMAKEQVRDGAY